MKILRLTTDFNITEVLRDWQETYPAAKVQRVPTAKVVLPWREGEDLTIEFMPYSPDRLRGRRFDLVVWGDYHPEMLSEAARQQLIWLMWRSGKDRESGGLDLMPVEVAYGLGLVSGGECGWAECTRPATDARRAELGWQPVCTVHALAPVTV